MHFKLNKAIKNLDVHELGQNIELNETNPKFLNVAFFSLKRATFDL